ncbi:MAG TPA: SprT-like domain-containing protein [Tepidisphaeraceae bacterium]|nr:SprT-like domain-containing protein [Tepidisphaeraceae bacterium]
MDLVDARKLARSLMDQHGLAAWQFDFDHARRRFGACFVTRRAITLSAYLVHLNTEAEVRDTILHEIAHALTPGDGHGARWKAMCVRLGAKPERCFKEADGVKTVRTRLRVGCARCGWWANRHRMTWAVRLCRKCRKPIQWEHVGSGKRYEIQSVPGGFQAVQVAVAQAAAGPMAASETAESLL